MCTEFFTEDGVLVIAAALRPPQLLSTSPKEMGKPFKQTLVTLQIGQPKGKTLCMGTSWVEELFYPHSSLRALQPGIPRAAQANVGAAAQHSLPGTAEPIGTPGTSACPQVVELLNARVQ